ncbi:MAG: hypothetical protein SGJ20_07895, partial [Planctomycetota bacterium]|nr:hypothetical protein [Planctomycetota bacterium]
MPILTLNRLRSLTGLASAGLVALLVVFTVTLSLLAEEAPTAPAPVNSAKADAAKGADTKKTAKAKKEPKPEKMLVTIGKETTVITEPLLPSGYPDYLAALNNEFKKGVTPDNNGAVVLVRVLGPVNLFRDLETNREAAEKRAANYYRQLGIEPLPEKGEYLQS